jgi:hypothetical protein
MKKLLFVLGVLFICAGKGAAQVIEVQATFYKDARSDTVCTIATNTWHKVSYSKTWERFIVFSNSSSAYLRVSVGPDTSGCSAVPAGGVFVIDRPATEVSIRSTAACTVYIDAFNKRNM